MSNIWFTSDQHFDHKNIIEYCNRPHSDLWEMTEDIIGRFNLDVKDADTTYHLGDFCFNPNNVKPILERLKGKHILIAGNHDRCFAKNGAVTRYLDAGFSEVHRRGLFLDEHELLLSHYPVVVCSIPDQRHILQPSRAYVEYACVHGHVHDQWKYKRGLVNVGVDQQLYAPVHVDDVLHQLKMAQGFDDQELVADVRNVTLSGVKLSGVY